MKTSKLDKQPRLQQLANYKWLFILSLLSLLIVAGLLLLALFEPPLPYTLSWQPRERNDSPEFLRSLDALTGAWLDKSAKLEVFTNGEAFYPAELDAIRAARKSVHLTAYIFSYGQVAAEFIRVLAERAKQGVEVKVVVDGVGSARIRSEHFKPLTDAGGRVAWYHPLKWYTWPRIGNRTHRELLVIDGRLGFTGGAGVADHWAVSQKDEPRWRDMMVRVEGDSVTGLQASFAEDWLEATGEILADSDYFPTPALGDGSTALVVSSTPATGRSTPARVLFQTLLASATKRIYINTPYFVPDHALRDEIARAANERNVEVKIVVPGDRSDHRMVRQASRRLFGELLRSGAQIYEYQPSMNHTKCLIVDSLWSVVGSTNMDSRSFGLNDEVSMAVRDPAFASRLEQDFLLDVSHSKRIDYEEWKRRGIIQRTEEWFGAIFERQQ